MILVTGATGNIGRELVSELGAKGAKFRVLVRDPARTTLPESAQRFTGDLAEPATLTPAFDGADRLFLVTPTSAPITPNTRWPPPRPPGCATSCTCPLSEF